MIYNALRYFFDWLPAVNELLLLISLTKGK